MTTTSASVGEPGVDLRDPLLRLRALFDLGALRTLAGAVRMLQMDLAAAAEPTEARSSAVAAAELSTEALDQTGGFAGQVVVAQTRSMAVDLLRAVRDGVGLIEIANYGKHEIAGPGAHQRDEPGAWAHERAPAPACARSRPS